MWTVSPASCKIIKLTLLPECALIKEKLPQEHHMVFIFTCDFYLGLVLSSIFLITVMEFAVGK